MRENSNEMIMGIRLARSHLFQCHFHRNDGSYNMKAASQRQNREVGIQTFNDAIRTASFLILFQRKNITALNSQKLTSLHDSIRY